MKHSDVNEAFVILLKATVVEVPEPFRRPKGRIVTGSRTPPRHSPNVPPHKARSKV